MRGNTVSIMLPGELDWVLDLLGFEWPNIDEDKLMDAAQQWRDFGQAVLDYQTEGITAANAVKGANLGDAADAFVAEWNKFADSGLGIGGHGIGYLDGLAGAAQVLGALLEVCAIVVIALKIYVIVQLIDLAIEFAVAQASAIVTLGGSEAAFAARVVMIRMLVRQALEEAAQKVEQATLRSVKEKVVEKAKEMIRDLAKDFTKDLLKEKGKDLAKELAVDTAKSVASEATSQAIKGAFGAGDGLGDSLKGFGVAAVNPAMGKVAGELEENDEGGYDFKAKAGGQIVTGAGAVASGDMGGFGDMAGGAGELFDTVKGEEKQPEAGGSSGEGGSSGGGASGSGGSSDSGGTSGGGEASGSGGSSGDGSSDSGSGSGSDSGGTPAPAAAAATPFG
ncbi:hypothetical protein [Streptomyces sp. NPDC057694]|uniref:WXG100-like domain-containing protein n=1 Tax=Streptomyces sp. NPDC057694 TaxID=3346216 RepID=UPI0036BF2026